MITLGTTSGEYDKSIWYPSPNCRKGRSMQVSTIVIHITDGQEKLEKSVEHLCKSENQVSAHFVIGRDGTIAQLVKIDDTAWHAKGANIYSIGIEHCARSPKELSNTDPGLPITDEQYLASARLVKWLCDHFNLEINRTTIQGHCELKDKDGNYLSTHRDCPNRIWDWDRYMKLINQCQEDQCIQENK